MTKPPLVVIIVPNFNGQAYQWKGKPMLQICLESLKTTTYSNFKIVVADDNSTDHSRQLVKDFKDANFVQNKPSEHHYAFTMNTGIRHAIKEYNPAYIMALNNDILISDKNWLTKLVTIMEKDPSIGMTAPRFFYPDLTPQASKLKLKWKILPVLQANDPHPNAIEEVSMLCGMMLIKRQAIDKVGLYDTNFVNGLEDIDLSIRIKRAGFQLMYCGNTQMIHIKNFTTQKINKGKIKLPSHNIYYFIFKNVVSLCGEKHA